ncbi:AraC family transcriptional regulator [Mycetocola tolaasinivorans]|uniref:AraC family transcriptional regulator n=1 Tax=Mycetocola tolaasinivorans TaxID=76635 RepID=A0A3L7ACD9_9MICO|nr:helix-turn-helix transcriptional regulator [Mycetocola tolaasinivorans]RLP77887.1 AraC family transcriptional regulator [Mycetocola tolaasinivorans]
MVENMLEMSFGAPRATEQLWHAVSEPTDPDGEFPAHSHAVDQLMWAPGGGMRVRAGGAQWRIPGDHLVWVPAHTEHALAMVGSTALLSVYQRPEVRPEGERFARPLVLPTEPLMRALFRELCAHTPEGPEAVPAERRRLSFELLRELLGSARESHDALALPVDPRARRVAEALLRDPADPRPITDWAAGEGISAKTLLRAFAAETGFTFAQWRTRARVYRVARLLGEGSSVQDAALRVGFATSTGCIQAFRGVFGVTPAVYHSRERGRA